MTVIHVREWIFYYDDTIINKLYAVKGDGYPVETYEMDIYSKDKCIENYIHLYNIKDKIKIEEA